jgi:hypothetical protein
VKTRQLKTFGFQKIFRNGAAVHGHKYCLPDDCMRPPSRSSLAVRILNQNGAYWCWQPLRYATTLPHGAFADQFGQHAFCQGAASQTPWWQQPQL